MEPALGYWVDCALPDAPKALSGAGLTDRELEVLQMVCQALPDKMIARRLSMSVKTVSTHLEHIYSKLAVRGDAQNARCAAMREAIALGLVPVPVS